MFKMALVPSDNVTTTKSVEVEGTLEKSPQKTEKVTTEDISHKLGEEENEKELS